MFSTQGMVSSLLALAPPKSQSDFSRSMKLKKILFVSSLLIVSGSAQAAALSPGSLVAGANAISTSDCVLLASPVSITLSTGNIGAYQCSALSANIGLAIASTSGKNKVFSISSAGGAITATEGRSSPTTSDLELAASSSAGDAVQAQTSNTNNGGDTSQYR